MKETQRRPGICCESGPARPVRVCVCVCVCVSVLDESPRWLMSRGQHDKAIVVLRRIARFNRRQMPTQLQLHAHSVRVSVSPPYSLTHLRACNHARSNVVDSTVLPVLEHWLTDWHPYIYIYVCVTQPASSVQVLTIQHQAEATCCQVGSHAYMYIYIYNTSLCQWQDTIFSVIGIAYI